MSRKLFCDGCIKENEGLHFSLSCKPRSEGIPHLEFSFDLCYDCMKKQLWDIVSRVAPHYLVKPLINSSGPTP